jgi:hypothetical protein
MVPDPDGFVAQMDGKKQEALEHPVDNDRVEVVF